jgi:hypothetical protein
MGRGVDHNELDSLRFSLLDSCANSNGMRGYDPRKFIAAPVGPFGRAGLWVNVKYGSFVSLAHGGNGEIKGDGRLSHAPLFRYDCDYMHAYTYKM